MTPIVFKGIASRELAGRVAMAVGAIADDRKVIEVVIRRPRTQRSLDQNAYAHAWPFRMIADAMGESVEAAKLCILGEKFGWHEVRGYTIPIKPSTAALSVEEFSELIEWMPVFGLETFRIHIPLPNEVPEAA